MKKMMRVITTDLNQNIFWKETTREITEVDCMNVVNIYPDCQRQEMKGFGGAFTESAGYNYSKLMDNAKKEFINAYFSKEGLDYSIGRTHINSCDFSLSNYAAVTDSEDTNFSTFTLEREAKYILPLMKDALNVRDGKIEFMLSPWSPPAFMKTNEEMNNGGKLKKEFYMTWAKYIAKYIKDIKAKGIDVQYMSVQNEPDATQTWDSCLYSAQEEMEFVRDYLGPVLEEQGLEKVKILVWDHNKEIVYERAKEILDDEKAAKYIYGIGVHWYTGDHFEGIGLVKERFPDKEIFFTEGCVEYSRFRGATEISQSEMYAHDMIGNFNHGVSAFFDWNLLLDAKGGPNHVGNLCAAPIMCTEDTKSIEKRLSYYYIGHFSKFIKKGAYCVATTKYSDAIEVCGFLNPDDERVIVLLNKGDKKAEVTIRERGKGINTTLQPHTITTIMYNL